MTQDNEHQCEFCKRIFSRERTLVNHLCEPKRRHLQRDDKSVQLGFMAYQKFYLRSMGRKQQPNYNTFARSKLYSAFVRFGAHLINLNAINTLGFMDFLLRTGAKIDRWTSDTLYATYIRELLKTEEPVTAIERNFTLMQQWSHDTGRDWHDFFRQIEPPLAVLWITSGRMSPWMLFTASSAPDLFDRLSHEQMRTVEQVIDREFWRIKINVHKDEVEFIRTMLTDNEI